MKITRNIKKTGICVVAALTLSLAFAGCKLNEVPEIQTPSSMDDVITTTAPEETTTLPTIEIVPGETTSTDETTSSNVGETTEPTTDQTGDTPGNTEGMARSYLTGKWVSRDIARKRPIAIVLSNIITAVPQSGIEKAEVIFETPVEGGITRLLALFEDYSALDKIGSVRSARLYHVYIALEFDAIFAHFGSAVYADELLNSTTVDNLSGLKGEGTVTYYRTTDRKAPHNAYTSAQGIAAGIKYKNYRTTFSDNYSGHFKFTDDNNRVVLSGANAVDATYVSPGYTNNSPWFEYNSTDMKYYRFQFGGKQVDVETGNQLAFDNVIFQVVDYYDYGDGYYYIHNQGNGTGKYITGGKCVDITWAKDEEFGITRYYYSDGTEVALNQGKTWISLVFDTNVKKIVVK
ncbi:MAG: DUF3048 domain-containing protein [Lachnospiraceae bacterium]|nr:DUF3048 domain-containing protein [Lachnospiraceae bacterium]